MNKSKLFRILFLSFIMLGTLASFNSCKDKNEEPIDIGEQEEGSSRKYFHIVLAVGDEGNDGTYVQSRGNLSTSSAVSFNGYGFEIPSTRTARVVGSTNGEYLYSLDYGGGTITKYLAGGGQTYTKLNEIDPTYAIGTTNPRWGLVADGKAMLHNVTTARIYKDEAGTEYDYTAAYAFLVSVNLGDDTGDMSMGSVQKLEIPRSAEDLERGLNIWRIDGAIVHNGKVYYGVAKRGYNPETNENISLSDYFTTTLIADYPSLKNLKTIESGVCQGENYGYRTPVNHVDEKGDIYQVVGNGVAARILKITNEVYDDSYDFQLSRVLGQEVGALGWFYVGNGIGYVPFYDLAEGQSEASSAWGIARVDIYNKTAVKMNIPYKLWLRQYQSAVLDDGKLYMALAPVGATGSVYIFDTTSDSADGFTVGTELENLAGQFYIGVY